MRARFPSFADLVVLAGSLNPIPSLTCALNSPAPMILSLKAWKSRSLPGLPKTENLLDTMKEFAVQRATKKPSRKREGFCRFSGRAKRCSIHLFVFEPRLDLPIDEPPERLGLEKFIADVRRDLEIIVGAAAVRGPARLECHLQYPLAP